MKTDKNMQQSMDMAEDSRQKEWKLPSFTSELFQGRFRWNMINPFPEQDAEDKEIGDRYLEKLKTCLATYIKPEEVDANQELPVEAREALIKIGAFRMKIPQKYGGLGLSNMNYARAISLVASYCGSTAVWLSAHQSIGVPQPLKLYGTEEQKKKFFKKLTEGAISAFALTEPDVGSDPARMKTRADISEDGSYYLLNGTKQWCTNGPDANLIIVMALTKPKLVRGKEKKQISAFILNMDSPGVHVVHRSRFMGIRGISNGIIRFENVRIPAGNLLGKEGEGLKIALETLNSGRLIIPACSAAIGKYSMKICRQWANKRVQWGQSIGKHQAVANMLSEIACETYAMESISLLSTGLSDQNKYDIRLEAAMAKYYGS
ncbi:MAG: acyl-CoA dehydrogenase family protein, partial [Bacteroidales bacterium]|nr:acyl-CoA dehydrogenase family protein [Bacteroidales bacterium]